MVRNMLVLIYDDTGAEYYNAAFLHNSGKLAVYTFNRAFPGDRRYFPRAIQHCLTQIEKCLRNLPLNEAPQYALVRAQRMVRNANVRKIVAGKLNSYINELQLALIDLNAELTSSYFEGREVSAEIYNIVDRRKVIA